MPYLEWVQRDQTEKLYSSEFWNSVEIEKEKAWYVMDSSDIQKLWDFIQADGVYDDFSTALDWMKRNKKNRGRILDVAAGVCWTTALLSREEGVSHIDAIDFSFHRIHDIAPNVIEGMKGDADKITRVFGSFYDLKPVEPYDVIFMSQAFHHADKPFHLLFECDRHLSDDGVIVLMGEYPIKRRQIARRVLRNLIKDRSWSLDFHQLFPADGIGGDHYYRSDDYQFIFSSLGYDLELVNPSRPGVMVARRQGK